VVDEETYKQHVLDEMNDLVGRVNELEESHRQMSNRIAELERLLQVQGDINGKVLDYLSRQDQPKSSIIIPHNRELN